jgi:hypothetical protein
MSYHPFTILAVCGRSQELASAEGAARVFSLWKIGSPAD